MADKTERKGVPNSTDLRQEDKFFKSMTELTDLVQELINDAFNRGYTIVHPIVVQLGSAYLSKNYNKERIIQGFIKYSHEHWDIIKARNEDFFSEHANSIFGDIPMKNVDAFKSLFTLKDKNGANVIVKEDRDAIWNFFDSFVKISIRYVFEGRQPSIRVDNNGNKKPVYLAKFFDEVALEHHAKQWGIKLEFTRLKG
jgi:hypothetical protein